MAVRGLGILTVLLLSLLSATPGEAASAPTAQMRLAIEGDPATTRAAVCRDLDTMLGDPAAALHEITGRDTPAAVRDVSFYRLGRIGFQDLVEIRYLFARERNSQVQLHLRLTLLGTREDGYCSFVAVEQPLSGLSLPHEARPTSRRLMIGSESFVESIVPISGTGNFRHEHYFRIVDGRPVELNLAEQARFLALGLAPQGTEIWKGSSFDLNTLQWRSGLWNRGDPNCCPSGGALFIQFRLNTDRLEVMEHELFHDWEAMINKHGMAIR